MILARGFKLIRKNSRFNSRMRPMVTRMNLGQYNKLMHWFSEDKKSKRRKRVEEEERRVREQERQRIMDELNKNKVNFSQSGGAGRLTLGRIAKYDLIFGSIIISILFYLNSEIYEDPVTESKSFLPNTKEARELVSDMFVENLIFEHSELYEESRKVTDNLVMVKENFQAQLESELGDVKVSNLVFLNVETPIFVILPNLTVIASRQAMVDMLSSQNLMKALCQFEISHLSLRSQFFNLGIFDNLSIMKIKYWNQFGFENSVNDLQLIKDFMFTEFTSENLIKSRQLLTEYGNRISPEIVDTFKDYLEQLDRENLREKKIGNLRNLSVRKRYANLF